MKKALFIMLVFFLVQPCFSQENYQKGFVIKTEGDTLQGFIDYRNWDKNPTKIFFKATLTDKKISFTPLTIKKFNVLDESYESGIVDVLGFINLNETITTENPPIEQDTTFLQVMINGTKPLYFYKDKNEKDHFYIKEDNGYKLLIYKKYPVVKDYVVMMAENKRYLNQLSYYLSDCPDIQSKIAYMSYTKKSMEKVFLAYYDCTHTVINFHKKTEPIKKEFGIVTGISATSLAINSTAGSAFASFSDINYTPSINLAAGLYLDIILSRNQQKWSIYNELLYSSYKTTSTYNDNYSQYRYTLINTTFGYSYIKMNNLVRFKYPIRKSYLFINVGLSNGLAISETNAQKRDVVSFGVSDIHNDIALSSTRKYEQGYLVGVGGKLNRFSVETRMEKGNGFSEYGGLRTIASRYFLLCSYKLNK